MTNQTVKCPIKGHKHELELKEHPERSDLWVAYCGDRIVIQTAKKYPKRTKRTYRKKSST